jgi:hypothetical protein
MLTAEDPREGFARPPESASVKAAGPDLSAAHIGDFTMLTLASPHRSYIVSGGDLSFGFSRSMLVLTFASARITKVDTISMPDSFFVVVGVLVCLFVSSFTYSVRTKAREPKYLKMNSTPTADVAFGSSNTSLSYQNSTSTGYVLPPPNNAKTYCVIDNRLMES